MSKPYFEVLIGNDTKYRLFKGEMDERELLWHHDERDREIFILDGTDWQFQFDDELPIVMKSGDTIVIPNHRFHRVIKGKGNLIVKILEK